MAAADSEISIAPAHSPMAQVTLQFLLVGVVVFAMAWTGIWLTREAGRVASIWFANAFLLSVVLAAPTPARLRAGAAALIGNVLANLASGDVGTAALGLALCNTVEVFSAVWLLDRFAPNLSFSYVRHQVLFVAFAALLAPIVSAMLAAVLLLQLYDAPLNEVFWSWWPADALGMLIIFPIAWSVRNLDMNEELQRLVQPRALLLLALVLVVTAIVFGQAHYPLLFIVLPPLVLVAFYTGFFGAAVAVLGVAFVSIGLTMTTSGPVQFVDGDLQERMFFLQGFLAVCVFLSLPVAAIVAGRRRMLEELREANEQVRKASAAKTEFLATMSHEIRTPLNSITGFTQVILANGSINETVRRQLDLIQQASAALVTIVDDVLDFSKIEANGMAMVQAPFKLRAMATSCCSIVRSQAESKGLSLNLVLDDDLPEVVTGDEARVRQVLLNLLGNAIKFTNVGTVSLTVTRESTAGSPGKLSFAVTDTGIGIPLERQSQLFESFAQIDSRISRQYGGTGLGLAISRRIAENMGGKILLDSMPGRGSTFTYLAVLPEAVSQAAKTDLSEIALAKARPAKLLLVEDLAINQEVVTALLTPMGHTVTAVSSGTEALVAIAEHKFDAILMDIQMPGMDGVETTRRIRAMPGRVGQTPIIALTANVVVEEIARFKRAGMNAHVGKPFERDVLLAQIERVIDGREALKSDDVSPPTSPELVKLIAVMGQERVDQLLVRFETQLLAAGVGDASADGAESEKVTAHKLISTAGLLGFTKLSDAARQLETAHLAQADLLVPRMRFQQERHAVLSALDEMKFEGPKPGTDGKAAWSASRTLQ
ncbi:ATP-binding protein [Devosia sp. J2-20]|uniref:hybrid sensor histidine kinase/response regulator n=1 Tax=Devosia sp. J2-20 TaxID=3026161 RepID=UPI00249A408A|nr:ATP-binding protein [Devosia sp. J2-20]WDQ97693.1 ATP-binding protein [Devosia sp. J2-20]